MPHTGLRHVGQSLRSCGDVAGQLAGGWGAVQRHAMSFAATVRHMVADSVCAAPERSHGACGHLPPQVKSNATLLVSAERFRCRKHHGIVRWRACGILRTVGGAGTRVARSQTARCIKSSAFCAVVKDGSGSTGGRQRVSVESTYKVLLSICSHLAQDADNTRLRAFLKATPLATSVPFMCWVSHLEGTAWEDEKKVLETLCSQLVAFRDEADCEGIDALYENSLRLLDTSTGTGKSLQKSDVRSYALGLAERVTGNRVRLKGFDLAYDLLLSVAPPAALTPEGIKKGHEEARELAATMRQQKKRSLAAILGRVKLTEEQESMLMTPSPAVRILDMLLSLSSLDESVKLLPECFRRPDGDQASCEGMDILWCTPLQLLNEVERRIGTDSSVLENGNDKHGDARLKVLSDTHDDAKLRNSQLIALRRAIREQWLKSLEHLDLE